MTAILEHQLIEPGFGTNRIWDLKDVPEEFPVDDFLKPETWANIAAKLRVGDEIVVKPQGLPYRAHLIVMDAGKGFAKVKLIDCIPLNAPEAVEAAAEAAVPAELPTDAPVSVKWNGPTDKFAVIRNTDKEKLRTGFAIRQEAVAWACKHITDMAT